MRSLFSVDFASAFRVERITCRRQFRHPPKVLYRVSVEDFACTRMYFTAAKVIAPAEGRNRLE